MTALSRNVKHQMSCDKVSETRKLFSLFCTVFAIWEHLEAHYFRNLEAFGSSQFSLFGSIWKLTVVAI
jgi:hypothetical protein